VCVSVYVCGQRLPFFLGAQSMLGQQGSVSLTSPSGACLELTQPCCAQCVCVFLRGKTLQAFAVPETCTNKLIWFPFLLSFCTQQLYTTPLMTMIRSEAVFKYHACTVGTVSRRHTGLLLLFPIRHLVPSSFL